MACGLDDNDKAMELLNGAPLCDVPLTDGHYALHAFVGTLAATTTKKVNINPPGRGCQKDADCTDSASPVCNLATHLCGALTCNEATDKTEPEKHFCQSTVIIAERNNDHTFTVKGFGAAVGEKHLLTSVTSKFVKYGSTELYAIVGGSKIHQIRAPNVFPETHMGDVSFNSWQDLYLVKLATTSTFKFDQFLKIKKVGPGPQDKSLTVRLGADKMTMDSVLLQSDDECAKIFSNDGVIKYVKNSYMACGLDDNDKAMELLNGAPLCDMPLTDGHHALHGIRSLPTLDPGYRNGFLVTKLAPNCDWLFQESGGAVKCI
uniref:VWFD domain-containing protein n=1 Tax=Panagrellus redivivus TaxID=6233 RepID=A0A7E4ZTH7_PANRE